MTEDFPRFTFPGAEPYAFWYEDAHLLLLRFKRDDAKWLFVIQGQREDGVELTYPGRLFCDQVMDAVEPIFFISVEEDDGEERQYVLGAYFETGKHPYAAYYDPHAPTPEVVFFRIDRETTDPRLYGLTEAEHQSLACIFRERYEGRLNVMDAGAEGPEGAAP
jgi:hypothetical protein